ncbi:hypothetical protein J4E85_009955 [Alternaria conjuncta]|uniref:uncharacterized protein n=1 Tax=Alternaria conjuncta TaxID=181017 RepID=UPI00221F7A71|nr:uncharacterized protein J4E85_009955 [Alternaria conjuncta]KAI4917436.1 hypothetical protein J4E85_009955 [Alternaria conjuncta]
MSHIIPSVAKLRPEIRLAEAVSQFEANLSMVEKASFRTDRSKALESPPGPNSVMRVTADIDRAQKAGSRCFGPRFTNFLHGVQQFAALGDVIIGGSQNIVACGVWSLVRMSLLVSVFISFEFGQPAQEALKGALVNSSSYLERLSLIFMDVGRSAPRYQALGLLYPRSKLLQSQISEYFIVVVHLCNRIMKFTRKSTFSKLGSTVNDSDVRELQAELNSWAKSIKEEVDLLMAQKIDMEVQSSSAFRALSTRHAKATEHQRKLAERLRILDMFSTHDYETPWRRIRKTGTTTSFLQTTEYHDWRDCKASTTLLYRGSIGSGKTVMMANIVNDLVAHIEGTDAVVAYHFCEHDSWDLNCQRVLGTLVRQILETVPDLTTLDPRHKHSFSVDQFVTLLYEVVPQSTHIWIVLDGLHNCLEKDRNYILLGIKELQSVRDVHLCASHRVDSHSLADMPIFRPAVVTLQPENAQDIEAFVDTELERCLTTRKLVLGDPALIFDIRDALMKGSQGMFLWATLQIESLCSMKTDKEIREALLDLPRNLTQVYNQILNQLQQPGRTYQTEIFKIITSTMRPLTMEEMQEALSVTLGDTTWDPSKLLNSVDSALATCGCLITVDEEDGTIRTVHPSVNQYLIQKDREGHNGGVCLDPEEARTFTASIMVTYLGYGLFGTELSSPLPAMQLGSAPSHIISSTLDNSKSVQSVALRFLRSMKESQFDATKVLAENLTLQSKKTSFESSSKGQYASKPRPG